VFLTLAVHPQKNYNFLNTIYIDKSLGYCNLLQ
jgi:hypothetical protein